MRMHVEVTVNFRINTVTKKVWDATRLGLRDTIVAMHADVVKLSPVQYGTNRRSIASAVSGMGLVSGSKLEAGVDHNGLEAAGYSTSGYGGYLEVGTGIYGPRNAPIRPVRANVLAWQGKSGEWIFAKSVRGRQATPYFRPAFDMHKNELVPAIKRHLEGS